jgi:hypothetical protein
LLRNEMPRGHPLHWPDSRRDGCRTLRWSAPAPWQGIALVLERV